MSKPQNSKPGKLFQPGADLRNKVLNKRDLNGVNLTGAKLNDAFLWNVRLEGANLTNADLTGARFEDAHLKGANLTNADLTGTRFEYAHLEGAILTNADLTGARFNGAHFDANTKIDGANLQGANFRHADFNGLIFDHAKNAEHAIGLPDNYKMHRDVRNVSRVLTRKFKGQNQDITDYIKSYLSENKRTSKKGGTKRKKNKQLKKTNKI